MSRTSRRNLLAGTVGGLGGLAVAARIADRFGLLPPDSGGLYGAGHALTYASHRLLTSDSLAREFPRHQISSAPFSTGGHPKTPEFAQLVSNGYTNWRIEVGGLVARPLSLSLADLRAYASRNQITQLICEEGWSYIAEWTGVPLAEVLHAAGLLPHAKYVVYGSAQQYWKNSLDLAEALHPQTLLTYGMNGNDLPPGHGGPLRLRVPRQLGYKSVKFVNRITVTDTLQGQPAGGRYSWYAGI
jgi:DMSO/TMAO reductase YedYZ molybdopterin-dependent catalytic subunit